MLVNAVAMQLLTNAVNEVAMVVVVLVVTTLLRSVLALLQMDPWK